HPRPLADPLRPSRVKQPALRQATQAPLRRLKQPEVRREQRRKKKAGRSSARSTERKQKGRPNGASLSEFRISATVVQSPLVEGARAYLLPVLISGWPG